MKSAGLLRRTRRSVGVIDTFTRADSTLPGSAADTGEIWDPSVVAPRVVSNKLAMTNGTVTELDVILVGSSNQLVQATISVLPTANYAGVVARSSDGTHYYLADVGTAGDVRLFAVAGSFTSIGTAGASNFVAGDRLGLSVIGSAIVVLKNGSAIITTTDTTNATGTKAGVRFNVAGTSVRLDDFSAAPA